MFHHAPTTQMHPMSSSQPSRVFPSPQNILAHPLSLLPLCFNFLSPPKYAIPLPSPQPLTMLLPLKCTLLWCHLSRSECMRCFMVCGAAHANLPLTGWGCNYKIVGEHKPCFCQNTIFSDCDIAIVDWCYGTTPRAWHLSWFLVPLHTVTTLSYHFQGYILAHCSLTSPHPSSTAAAMPSSGVNIANPTCHCIDIYHLF